MITLAKGANAPLSATNLTVTVDVAASADLSALLVTEAGKVRSDADFIFYNQPSGPGVTCVPASGGQGWRVDVDLTAVPADVHAVRLVTSLDDGGRVFGQVGQPVARIASGGQPVAEFPMTGLDRETIVVMVELYRRNGEWKVRAVGRGYDGGLADLIRDHGVSVDDEPATPAPAAPALAAPAPSAPPAAPPAAAPSYPPAPQQPPAAPSYPPSTPSYPPSAPSYPPAPQQPPAAPSYPPSAPSYPPAASSSPQQSQPPQQPAAPAGGGEVSLRKGASVSLQKGQRVRLTKDGGQKLTQVRMGLGWDPVRKGGLFGSREVEIDLDASVVLFASGQPVDLAFYNNLTTRDGSVRHLGDNRTGEGDGDDETIVVDLTRVPVHVDALVFIVTSYGGQTFQQVQNAFCRLIDHTDGELARYTLTGGLPVTGMVMAKVYREGGDWKLQAIGDGLNAKVPGEAVPQLAKFL